MNELVSEKALIKRLKRKLEKQGLCIEKNPKGPYMQTMGEYLIKDIRINSIVQTVDDIEAFAREEGVLKDGESLDV